MFARLLAVASLAAFVIATPNVARSGSDECSTGSINCCNTVYQASDVHNALSQAGINLLAGVTGVVGSGCSPISGVGVGNTGGSCSANPVCCNDNQMNGVVVIGCSPIDINL